MEVDELEEDDYVSVSDLVCCPHSSFLTVSQACWAQAASLRDQQGWQESCQFAKAQGQHITAHAQDCKAPGWIFAAAAPIQGGSARQRISGK